MRSIKKEEQKIARKKARELKKKARTKLQKVGNVLGKVLWILLAILFGWMILSSVLTDQEQKKYPPIGKMVQVDAKTIHVYEKGEGGQTYVLMTGLGTTAPALDFEPLVEELSKDNHVVVIEPAGYGWSSQTTEDRTVDTIVSEYRTALQKAKIDGPYILVPHSIAGIYALYYANTYPTEVSGVIGIDCTLPTQMDYFGEQQKMHLPLITDLVAPCGISRLLTVISPDSMISENTAAAYSEENLKMQKAISSWRGYNSTIVNEFNHANENMEKTKDMKFSSELPLLFFTYDRGKKTEDGKNSESFYNTYISNSSIQKVEVLNGRHYLHWTCSKQMATDMERFFPSDETLAQ